MKRVYITTPIYYPSARMHIGNSFPTVIADILARYYRQWGDDVFFLTGLDEHGQKIEKIALNKNISPLEYVQEMAEVTKQLWSLLNISNDDFIETTQERHRRFVSDAFDKLLSQDDIYLGKYTGHYCVPCEAFWTKTQLKEGKCPDCGRDVYFTEEEAYFFRTGKYVDQLLQLYQGTMIDPEWIKKEMMNNFLSAGLSDLCITRTSFTWGIPVKANPKHVIYVWFDALMNYLSALEGDRYTKFWENGDTIIHLHGKEIARFHLIYWPMFLLALGKRLPTKLLTHSWIILGGQKIGKSLGNAVDPIALMEHYGTDRLRFFLANLDIRTDCHFSLSLFLQTSNDYLANDLGNLLRRTTSMIIKYRNGIIPSASDDNEILKQFNAKKESVINNVHEKYQQARINEAIAVVFDYVHDANRLIDVLKPWELFTISSPLLDTLLLSLANCLRVALTLLHPIMPESTLSMLEQLGCKLDLNLNADITGLKVETGKILFSRLDLNEEEKKFHV